MNSLRRPVSSVTIKGSRHRKDQTLPTQHDVVIADTLDAALHYHLSANHYSPHPAAMVPIARQAIEAAAAGETTIALGVLDEPYPVAVIIEDLHLEPFVAQRKEN